MCVKIKRLSVKCLCVSILTETLIHNLKNGCMKRYLTVIVILKISMCIYTLCVQNGVPCITVKSNIIALATINVV